MADTEKLSQAAQVRMGLTQFIGAYIHSVEGGRDDVRQLVVAALLEEAMMLCIEKGRVNGFAAKPVLRAAIRILQKRAEELMDTAQALPSGLAGTLGSMAKEYRSTAGTLQKVVDSFNRKGKENDAGCPG